MNKSNPNKVPIKNLTLNITPIQNNVKPDKKLDMIYEIKPLVFEDVELKK